MQRFFQIVAWLLVLAIVALSIGPPTSRPVTGAGHNLEHFAIFMATGAAFGFGYPLRVFILPIAMLAFSAVIELAQLMVPGRHARLSDFLTDATAACLGVFVSLLVVKFAARKSVR